VGTTVKNNLDPTKASQRTHANDVVTGLPDTTRPNGGNDGGAGDAVGVGGADAYGECVGYMWLVVG
jgi:hypothetical protein